MKSRIYFVFAGFLFLWSILILRAAALQVFPNKRLEALKEKQFQTFVTLPSRRGAIVDRNGRDLAISTTSYSVFADPKLVTNPKAASRQLAKILDKPASDIFAKVKNPSRRFVWLDRRVEKNIADQIKLQKIKGIQVVEEFKRVYPNETLAAQVLGFVGNEGQGLEGLELLHESELAGNQTKVRIRRDARGRPLVMGGMMFAENPEGSEFRLTLDAEIQHTLENELVAAVEQFEADSAVGVILDAKTSAVIAAANAPLFDLTKANKTAPEFRRNRVVTDAFEPGSTMKTFVLAAALDEKIVAPNTYYNTENGVFKVGDRIIREAESKHRWPKLTVSEILAYSSNIGTAKVAFDLKADKLRQRFLDFGFGQVITSEFPGAAKGILQPLPWRPHLLANISFGHGISVTPLQIANAYAAIANGGELNRPYIIHSKTNLDSGETQVFDKKTIGRILKPETAASLRLMLAAATTEGATGVNARVEGFPVAGKTGTAQKVNPNGRGYLPGGYISSFAGFFPVNDPKYVLYIAIDHPKKKNSYYGSQVAAPVFSRMAGYIARKEGLAPAIMTEKNIFAAKKMVAKIQDPNAGSTSTEVKLKSDVIPDLAKMSLRSAVEVLGSMGVDVSYKGQGSVITTVPAAGEPMPASKKITLILGE